MNFRFFLIILFFLSSIRPITAQVESIKFEHYGAENGLSQNSVYSILQDSKGYLWVGTKDGLNRFDGYNFKHYKHLPNDSLSLSDNSIRSIFEDENGTIWIGTEYNGLNYYNRAEDRFFPIRPSNSPFRQIKSVFSMDVDNYGRLWVNTRYFGLLIFNREKNDYEYPKFTPNHDITFPFQHATSILIENDLLWIGTSKINGLARVNLRDNTYDVFMNTENFEKNYDSNIIYDIHRSSNGELWLATVSGLIKFDEKSKSMTHFPLNREWKNTHIKSFEEDDKGVFWLATDRFGVCRFDPKTELFNFYRTHSQYVQNDILTIFKDNEGLMWIGLNGDGLSKFDPTPQFSHFTFTNSEESILSSSSVRSIVLDESDLLWIGDYGGLNRYHQKNGNIARFRYEENNPYSLQNNNIYSLLVDDLNQLWVGTEGDGLYRYERATNRFIQIYEFGEDYDFVFEIFQDKKNTIWVGTYGGLITVNRTDTRNSYDVKVNRNILKTAIFAIEQDQNDHIWLGTEANGIVVTNEDGTILTHFVHDQKNGSSLGSNKIKSIFCSQDGEIWIGTNGSGLSRYNEDEKIFQHFTMNEGLPNNVIYGILEDNEKNLWMSTNVGLSKMNTKTRVFTNYTQEDGLQSNEFNTASFYQSKTGDMYFGGINGLTKFNPENVFDNLVLPSIQITGFKLFNKSVQIGDTLGSRVILKENISITPEIELKYSDNFIMFEFTSLSFTAPDKNQYAYRLENFNEDWVYTDSKNRVATFTNLEPGEYRFKVIGTNEDGRWNMEGQSLKIVIIPPIWATWWAYSFYVVLIILIILFYVRWKIHSTQMMNIKLKELVDDKTAELSKQNIEIQSQYELISGVIESMTDPFYVVDVNKNKIVLQNSAAKNSPLDIHKNGFDKIVNDIIFEVVKRNTSIQKETSYSNNLGKLIDIEISAFPISGQDQDVAQVIYYWKNISDRKIIERSRTLDLQVKSNELRSKILSTSNLNEQLEKISHSIANEIAKSKDKENPYINIHERLKKLISTEQDDFDYWFNEENKDFFERLKQMNSSLTQRELRVCSLLRLNLNTKEIAELFQLAPKSIEVYRSQIRIKLNISKEINLNKFIADL